VRKASEPTCGSNTYISNAEQHGFHWASRQQRSCIGDTVSARNAFVVEDVLQHGHTYHRPLGATQCSIKNMLLTGYGAMCGAVPKGAIVDML
jgi:hypothetical protein